MATLREHNENVFKEEHQRLFRALMESKAREANLNRQFRQMKEDLVSIAMRVQVASQVAEVDNHTISSLRKEVTAARKEAFIANRQFGEATDAIVGLKREITALKRKLKEVQTEQKEDDKPMNVTMPQEVLSGGAMLGAASSFADKADHEVDSLMSRKINIPLPNGISTSSKTTTFQEWKMQQFLYAPDTLAGSKNHDKSAVDLLNKAASEQSFSSGDVFHRSTRSIAAKQRPLDANPISNAASMHRKEGTEEQIVESIQGVMFPSMKSKNRSDFTVHKVPGSLLSSPPKGGKKKVIV
jgi:hypothetical protein